MATNFKNKVIKNIGTTPTTVVTTAANARATIIGCSVANIMTNAVLITITIEDATATEGYYIKDVMVPPNSSLKAVNGGEKIVLAENNTLRISANVDNAADLFLSYVEIV